MRHGDGVCAPLCRVILNIEPEVATGLVNVTVKVPDPLVILAPEIVPAPSSNVPELL